MKKIIGIAAAAVIVLGLSLVIYNQIIPDKYVPADDDEYSGGISNADGSLIQHDSDNIVVWNREELNLSSDTFELSMQFRIITEYVAPNYENVYPDDITKYMEPISWEARFGESYCITITGDQTNGYQAILN